MASLNKDTWIRYFLGQTPEKVAVIKQDTEQVCLGLSTTIGSLSTSGTFDLESGDVIMQAIMEVEAIRLVNPNAKPGSLPGATLGHLMRQQGVRNPQGFVWGP